MTEQGLLESCLLVNGLLEAVGDAVMWLMVGGEWVMLKPFISPPSRSNWWKIDSKKEYTWLTKAVEVLNEKKESWR